MKHVMKVSHTQADAFLLVEETERNGRIARAHGVPLANLRRAVLSALRAQVAETLR